MAPSPILVTGAAGGRRHGTSAQGSTGYHVTRLLLDGGQPVRAFVHRLDERSEELLALGAEVVEGDLLDLTSVRGAMEGVRRSYFTYPVQAGLLYATTTFAVAARDAGSELVVDLSQLLSRERGGVQPTPHQNRHWLAEQVLGWAGIGVVHLNAVAFYENLLAMASGSLSQAGVVALPWGPASTRIPMVSAEDVARVAAGVLTGPPVPNATVLPLIGDVVTNQRIADSIAEILGRPVPYVELSDEQWLQAISSSGINDVAVEHLVHLWRYLRSDEAQGQDGYRVTDAIERFGGSAPQSLPEFLRQKREAFASVLAPTAGGDAGR
jgi:uncharacterized protein YbjT (DUF2867 family)